MNTASISPGKIKQKVALMVLRDSSGMIHHRKSVDRMVDVIRAGRPAEMAQEWLLVAGETFDHPELGRVLVVARARLP